MRLLKQVIAVGMVGGVLIGGTARGASAAQAAQVSVDDDAIETRIASELKANSSLAPRDIDVEVKQGIATLKGTVRTAAEKATAEKIAADIRGVFRVNNQIEVDPNADRSTIDAASEKTKEGTNKAIDATSHAAQKTKEAVEKAIGKSEEGVGKAAEKSSDAIRKVGDKASDASVTTLVKSRLSGEKILNDSSIDVDTDGHVVTLKGTVPSTAAKAKAVEIARNTDGVTRVIDHLNVKD